MWHMCGPGFMCRGKGSITPGSLWGLWYPCPPQDQAYSRELLCSLLRGLLRIGVARGLPGGGPRGRVLGCVRGEAWSTCGEE